MNLFILVEHLAVGKQSRQIRHFLLFLGSDLEPGRPHISSVQFHHEWDAPNGALAQLGEHLLCKQGVIGSIPIRSTKLNAQHSASLWQVIACSHREQHRAKACL